MFWSTKYPRSQQPRAVRVYIPRDLLHLLAKVLKCVCKKVSHVLSSLINTFFKDRNISIIVACWYPYKYNQYFKSINIYKICINMSSKSLQNCFGRLQSKISRNSIYLKDVKRQRTSYFRRTIEHAVTLFKVCAAC